MKGGKPKKWSRADKSRAVSIEIYRNKYVYNQTIRTLGAVREIKKNISHLFAWALFDAKNEKPFLALTIVKNKPSIRSKLYAETDLRVVEAVKIAPPLS